MGSRNPPSTVDGLISVGFARLDRTVGGVRSVAESVESVFGVAVGRFHPLVGLGGRRVTTTVTTETLVGLCTGVGSPDTGVAAPPIPAVAVGVTLISGAAGVAAARGVGRVAVGVGFTSVERVGTHVRVARAVATAPVSGVTSHLVGSRSVALAVAVTCGVAVKARESGVVVAVASTPRVREARRVASLSVARSMVLVTTGNSSLRTGVLVTGGVGSATAAVGEGRGAGVSVNVAETSPGMEVGFTISTRLAATRPLTTLA